MPLYVMMNRDKKGVTFVTPKLGYTIVGKSEKNCLASVMRCCVVDIRTSRNNLSRVNHRVTIVIVTFDIHLLPLVNVPLVVVPFQLVNVHVLFYFGDVINVP